MSLIPEEEIRRQGSINLAPMVDFLFVIIAVFAALALTRTILFDNEIKLVKLDSQREKSLAPAPHPDYIVNVSVTENGEYHWITETSEYLMESIVAINEELARQQQIGLLPKEKEKIKVLAHIDTAAQWQPIVELLFGVRNAGFEIHPVYNPLQSL